MAINTAYPKGMEKVLSGQINLATDTIKVAIITSAYTYSTAHEFASQLGVILGGGLQLQNQTVAGGVFGADSVSTAGLAKGSVAKGLAFYKDTGNLSTSPLLFYRDNITGFSMNTTGGGITLNWADGPLKIAAMLEPFFPSGGELVMRGGVNFLEDDIKVALMPASFDPTAGHQFLSDVGATIGQHVALTGRSVTGGVFNATDADFGNVPVASVGSVLMYKDTGNPATSPVLQNMVDGAGLPFDSNGGPFKAVWSEGGAKIFSLIPA